MKSQSDAIRQLERNNQDKVGRNELSQLLAQKLGLSDIQRSLSELQLNIDQKPNFEHIQLLLQDYALKKDFEYLNNTRITHEDVRKLIEFKANDRDTKLEFANLGTKIEELEAYVQQQGATKRDIQFLNDVLLSKANTSEMNELLDTKANKQTVSNALHKKVKISKSEAPTYLPSYFHCFSS